MNNQQAVVDQIVQNLAFEVEAVPKNKSMRSTSIPQSTPLNVKIKVRKKEETLNQLDISTLSDGTKITTQKVRLVSSDQTIMNFDVFMEAEFEKKPSRKFHKQVFDKLRPGICLGAADDDEYVYMPSSSYSANITAPAVATKSDGILKQSFTLSKNTYQTYTVSNEPVKKWPFGKCKPGGCLDPPFSEDKYPYKPSTRMGPESIDTEPKTSKLEGTNADDVECDVSSDQSPSKVLDEDAGKTDSKRGSFFEGVFFKKKRKSSDKSTSTLEKTDSISKLNHVESPKDSLSEGSNTIITYPPKISSDLKISDDKTNKSKGPSEDRSRKSFNDFHSEPYFIPPKGINRIKEKDTLNQKDSPKRRPSDDSESKSNGKDSIKMPTLIPVPVPIPVISGKVEPKDTKKYDTLPKHDENAIEEIVMPDEELKEISILRPELVTADIDKSPLKLENEVLTNVQQPDMSLSDSNSLDSKPQPDKKTDSENNIKEINLIKEKEALDQKDSPKRRSSDVSESKSHGKESIRMPIPIPVPIPVISGKVEPKDTKKYETLPKPDENALDEIVTPDEELKDISILRPESVAADIDKSPLKLENEVLTNVQQPALSPSDSNSLDSKRQPDENKDIENNIEEINLLKEKEALNQKDSPKRRSSDVSESKSHGKESIKMPIPIPVPIPVISGKVEPKDDTEKYDTSPTQDENALDKIVKSDEELKEISNVQPESDTEVIENKPSILESVDLANVEQPVVSLNDSNPSYIETQPEEKKYRENSIDRDSETDPFITPIPVPIKIKSSVDSTSENKSSKNSLPRDTNSDEKEDPLSDFKYLRTKNDSIDEEKSQSETTLSEVPTMKEDMESDSKIKQVTKQIIKPDDDDSRDFKTEDNVSLKEDSTFPTSKEMDKISNLSSLKEGDIQQSYEDPNAITITSKEADSKSQSSTDKDFQEKDRVETPILSKAGDEMTTIPIGIPQSYLSEIPKFPRKDESTSYIIAPILIEKTEPSKNYDFDKPITDGIDQTKKIDDNKVSIPSTASDELIGPKTDIYYLEEIPPATSEKKTERPRPSFDKHVHLGIGLGGLEIMQKPSKTSDEAELESSTASTSTLKSVLKKDVMSVELGFHSFINDKNVRVLRTFDTGAAPTRYPNDSVTVIRSQLRISSKEIRIPVDSDHDFSIQIKKANGNQRVSISDSGFITVDSDRSTKQQSPTQGYAKSVNSQEQQKIQRDVPDNSVMDLYERELMPLQTIIKNLRDEIDVLAAQQTIFKDKMICPQKSKLPRLVHSHKKCIGCVKK